MDRFVINDTFRSSLCVVHPPHLIAIAAIWLAFSLHPPVSTDDSTSLAAGPAAHTRRQSAPDPPSHKTIAGGKTDAISFLASLNVSMPLVLEIVQEVIALYELWNSLERAVAASTAGASGKAAPGRPKITTSGADERVVAILTRMRYERKESKEGSGGAPGSESGSGSARSHWSRT